MGIKYVAGKGDVTAYCQQHGYRVQERYFGAVEDYKGEWAILVTAEDHTKAEYYRAKYLLLKRGIELVSTHWQDDELENFVSEMAELDKAARRKRHRGGRPKYGYRWENGEQIQNPEEMAVVQEIFALRDSGATYQKISEKVRRPDGSAMSVSTIQVILKNRRKYE